MNKWDELMTWLYDRASDSGEVVGPFGLAIQMVIDRAKKIEDAELCASLAEAGY